MVRPTSSTAATSALRLYLSSRALTATITPRRAAAAAAATRPSILLRSSPRAFSTSRLLSNTPKSPFAVFVDTLKAELRKNQELQENMRQLSGDVGKMQDSETMKKMRDAYERARIITSIKENPKLQAAADALRKSGGQVGDAVGATLKQMEESELIKGLGAISSRLARGLEDSTAPIRNTEAYKQLSETLTEAFDDGGSALRIYVDADKDVAEVRRIKREARLRKIGRPMPTQDVDSKEAAEAVLKSYAAKAEEEAVKAEEEAKEAFKAAYQAAQGGAKPAEDGAAQEDKPDTESASEQATQDSSTTPTSDSTSSTTTSAPPPPPPKPAGYAVRLPSSTLANPSAGSALVLRPEPAYKQAWSSFKSSNPLLQHLSSLREAYHESENPVVERVRAVTDWFGSLFDENDFARVTRQMKLLDPTFTLESFQRDLREYVVPEIIDAYHTAARHLLRQWCGEATYNLLLATIDPYLSKGYLPTGRLLDLKQVEILQAKVLDNNVPVLVVSFTSQELMFFTDPKTGEVKAGNESQPDLCRYAMVLTRVEDELDNQVTGGWKVVELARRGQAAYL